MREGRWRKRVTCSNRRCCARYSFSPSSSSCEDPDGQEVGKRRRIRDELHAAEDFIDKSKTTARGNVRVSEI
eukprot:749223-Hanusia_phi.AAC.4